ncbi:MAG: protein kinase [Planctomycetota bacterium]
MTDDSHNQPPPSLGRHGRKPVSRQPAASTIPMSAQDLAGPPPQRAGGQAGLIRPVRVQRHAIPDSGVQLPVVQAPAVHAADSDQRYTFRLEIGRGGMGAVQAMYDSTVRRDVAMKRMLVTGLSDEAVARFVAEGQVTGQLEHPNIVPVYDIGADAQGDLFITMKYVRGRSLRAVIDDARAARSGKRADAASVFPLNARLDLFRKVADAISYAHERGVIHRDLKPDNIMVGRFGEVHVMDWGLARVIGAPDTAPPATRIKAGESGMGPLTQDGAILGTPGYLAPEQVEGAPDDIDARSDVFALGCVLYELLTFTVPFEGLTAFARINALAQRKLERPGARARRGGLPHMPVPAELEAIVLKAMAFEPTDRYASVADLTADMDRFRNFAAVSVYRDGLGRRISKWSQRHPGAAIASALSIGFVLLAGVAGAIGLNVLQQQRAAAEHAQHEQETERLRIEQQAAELRAQKSEEQARRQAAENDLRERNTRVMSALREGFTRNLMSRFTSESDTLNDMFWSMGNDNVRMLADLLQITIDGTPPDEVQAEDYLMLGYLCVHVHRIDEALPLLDKACTMMPDNPMAYLARAQARQEAGNTMGAFGDAATAYTLSKGQPALRARLRKMFEERGIRVPEDD